MGADSKFAKCGEILIDLKRRHKKSRIYTYHCTFCETTWDQMKKFSMHVEAVHFKYIKDETHDIPMIFEPEIKIETPTDDKMLETEEDKFLLDEDAIKEDPLEMEEVAADNNPDNENEKPIETTVKDEDDNKKGGIGVKVEESKGKEESDDNDDDDNDEDDDDEQTKEDDSSSCEEAVDESAEDSEPYKAKNPSKKMRKCIQKGPKRQKNYKEYKYLAIDSGQKDLNVALLQAFEKKPLLWDVKDKCRNEMICQRAYEDIAIEVNDKLGTEINWEFAKNRLNIMRFECSFEVEKKHNGEAFKMPWYHEHMKYLEQNIVALTKDRIKKKRFKNIDETNLPAFIELYKKYEDLWQVNGVFFGITSKRDEIFNNMIEELKQNWNITINFERLRNHIQYINRLYSKDREIELRCELAQTEFSPVSKFYSDLSFLRDCQGPFRCPHCNDIIKKYETYHVHVAHHTNSRPFKCPLCEYAFKKFDTCVSHVKRHLSENSFRCDICGKGYPKKSELDRHLTYHTGEKPFLCQICGNGFRTSRDHDNHVRRHENRFRYECHICKMGFNHMHTLNDHVKSHLNVRDILCNVCGKGFTAQRYLNNHKLIHEDKKHYKCHICGKEFAQGAGLRAHRKLHKPYIPPGQVKKERKEETAE